MKRTFANLGAEASIKNTLPSVNGDDGNKQAIVPYKSRSGSIEIPPQEEYPFEVGSSGEAIYYMKQERENLKTVGLYTDSESKANTVHFNNDCDADVQFGIFDDKGTLVPQLTVEPGDQADFEYDLDEDSYGIKVLSSNIEVDMNGTPVEIEEHSDYSLVLTTDGQYYWSFDGSYYIFTINEK